jgi:predicted nucleic acid-binding protein
MCTYLCRLTARINQNQIDMQIASMALLYDLTVVTRNVGHFAGSGARILNPFADSVERAEEV